MPAPLRHPGARDVTRVPVPTSVSDRRHGFALIITIVLVAFLVLILVGLATFTRVETQVATNNQQLSQARQNALMALNIAVGELQKYTGPDQRTTARSDMDATLANTTTKSGRWLGAYGNAAEADYAMKPSAISAAVVSGSDGYDSLGRQSTLLNWLVSGNENTAFNASSDTSATGRVTTAPSQFEFSPAGAVAGLAASSTALSTDLTVANRSGAARPAQLLVGPNTAGDSVADYVVAPLREISAVAPGLGTTPVPVGRYAWWVGDEGAKARVDLPEPTAAQAANAFVSNPRAGVELVDAVHRIGATSLASADMLDPAGTAGRYDPASSAIQRLLSVEQFPMIAPAQSAALSTAIKYRFHDLGVSAASVLADSYAGGLKKDLSAILATGSSTPADTELLYKPESGATDHLGVPTWGQLRSFAQTASSSAGLAPRTPQMAAGGFSNAPVPTNVPIAPVMTYAAMGFRYLAPAGDAVGARVSLVAAPIVVLWNPYTVPIRGIDGSGNRVRYEMGMRKNFAAKLQLQGQAAPIPPATLAPWSSAHVLSTISLDSYGSDRYLRFLIESPAAGIQPGESLVFTLENNGDDYSAGANKLINGMNDHHFVALRSFDYTISAALGAGATYRVGVNPLARYNDSVPITMWNMGSDTTGNWGGAGSGWHEAYFGASGVAWPDSDGYPWTAGLAGRGIYQAFSHVTSPSTQTPPYGNNYPQTGYAVSSGPSGLIQPAGTLGANLVTHPPAFRMLVHAAFAHPTAAANLPYGRTRWMLQHNIRGFMMVAEGASIAGRATEATWPANITSDDDLHVASGTDIDDSSPTPNKTILYEFRPDTLPLLSIGQLQHANLGWLSNTPGYAIGNSNGGIDYAVGNQRDNNSTGFHYNGATRAAQRLSRADQLDLNPPGNRITARYDQSWLLNRSLWDKYFVSTVPHAGTGRQAAPADTNSSAIPATLPNPLHVRHGAASPAQLRDPDVVAAKLLLKGGFNINSTSEQAWRAVLGGSNQLEYDPTGSNVGGSATKKIVFSRFSQPATNSRSSPWSGYVQLDEVQVARLAKDIVAEVRARGPFVSLGDFVNRRLADGQLSRLKGTIQAAIDATTSGPEAANRTDDAPLVDFAGASSSYKVVRSFNNAVADEWEAGSATPATPTAPYGTSGAGAPQFLTQADVLSAIGSKLSARSDTFVIRTYGEMLDPVNSTSAAPVVVARAWCEAVVQRLPEYVDTSIDPEIDLRLAPASPAKTTNQHFGRKYQIVSFRWLSPDDI